MDKKQIIKQLIDLATEFENAFDTVSEQLNYDMKLLAFGKPMDHLQEIIREIKIKK